MEVQNIAYINYTASGGGAGKICSTLHSSFENSVLYNCYENEREKGIIKIDNFSFRNRFHKLITRFQIYLINNQISLIPRVTNFLLNYFSEPIRSLKVWLGYEDFCFPGTSEPQRFLIKKPTLVHAHNLFPGYFDLRILKKLSVNYPILITAHDCWLMTGHCAHPINCSRFVVGCGECPDLNIPPSIERDKTKYNLKYKLDILKKSNVFLATPCEWLKKTFENSLTHNLFNEVRVIPNGIKTNQFYPLNNKRKIRKELNLLLESTIFIFVANKTISNPWKNFTLMLKSLQALAFKSKKMIYFICIGENHSTIQSYNFECIFISPLNELKLLNEYYNCADYYFHLSKADTFPNTILEAQSCGVPVFANPICGIPEQIIESETGWFINETNPQQIANFIFNCINKNNYNKMSTRCRSHIVEKFCSSQMVIEYNKYYNSILSKVKY